MADAPIRSGQGWGGRSRTSSGSVARGAYQIGSRRMFGDAAPDRIRRRRAQGGWCRPDRRR
jgi:hypothetical protein